MDIIRIAAFADGAAGGNPAGVVLSGALPPASDMQRIAREIGYSETAFAAPQGDGWRVRYFAPEIEVPFCGHATIALGTALGRRHGAGRYPLALNDAEIAVEAEERSGRWSATLTSPPARSVPLDPELTAGLLDLFGLDRAALDPALPPTLGWTGPRHAILALRDRAALAAMSYPFETLRDLMRGEDLTTIMLIHVEGPTRFVARNAFAIGGVVEDPATGAAAAALGGALVDLDWPALRGGGGFVIRQGEDMGAPSRLNVTVTGTRGDPVRVSGTARMIEAP